MLDELWTGWIAGLTVSYEKTLCSVEAGKRNEACEEFHETFLTTVRCIYSEAAVTAPKRFAQSENWSAWLRHLYALSVKTGKSLRSNSDAPATPSSVGKESGEPPDCDAAAKSDSIALRNLDGLRTHFHRLHAETEALNVADRLHTFRECVKDAHPDATKLGILRKALIAATPSTKAKAEKTTFLAARDKWDEALRPILEDGAVDPAELTAVRAATDAFYRAFGVQFE